MRLHMALVQSRGAVGHAQQSSPIRRRPLPSAQRSRSHPTVEQSLVAGGKGGQAQHEPPTGRSPLPSGHSMRPQKVSEHLSVVGFVGSSGQAQQSSPICRRPLPSQHRPRLHGVLLQSEAGSPQGHGTDGQVSDTRMQRWP